MGSKSRPAAPKAFSPQSSAPFTVPTSLSLLSASDVCLVNPEKSPRCWPAASMRNEVTAPNSRVPRHLLAAVTPVSLCHCALLAALGKRVRGRGGGQEG